jgi:D-glycero-D-manno-heptose 1,7-bisphosphate phosphatase
MRNSKIAFFDLDGTLREPASDKRFISSPTDQRAIAGTQEVVRHLHKDGWIVIGVSNQGGVPEHKSLEDCVEEQQFTLELFPEMVFILAAPGMGGVDCVICDREERIYEVGFFWGLENFRKPSPDMIILGMRIFGARPNACFLCGDRDEDKGAAAAAGIDFYPASEILSLPKRKLHKLYLIRGISGSGKSTLAREIAGANQVAADDFPGLYDGGYQWGLQKAAHSWCQDRCEEMMREGLTPIAVHNTVCKLGYLKPYQEMAEKYGYRVSVLTTEGNYGNCHDVPPDAIEKQRKSFELL